MREKERARVLRAPGKGAVSARLRCRKAGATIWRGETRILCLSADPAATAHLCHAGEGWFEEGECVERACLNSEMTLEVHEASTVALQEGCGGPCKCEREEDLF